jgi:WS/DGAT/MGAT family acyltransferase
MLDLPLPKLRKIRRALGGSVNDVVLAMVAGALRAWLTTRGETLVADLRVLVPVSFRTAHGRNTFGNQISAVFCPLPVGDPNPAERLRKVRESMKGLKESGQAVGAQALTRLGDFAPPTILAQAARLQAVTRFFNLVVTNVPGPQFPLYLLGRRLLSCYPQVPLAAQQTVGIALLSYAGNVGVGLLADLDVRDLAALAGALQGSLDELSAVAEANPRETAPLSDAPPPREVDSTPPPRAEMASVPSTPQQDPARTPGI